MKVGGRSLPHDPEKYLHDVLSSCEFLLEFTAGRSVNDFTRDRAFRSAVERELQIVGEAVIQLERVAPQVAARISEYRNIIGFRHVLVHGYDSVHPATVWKVIELKVPVLATECRTLIDEYQAGGGERRT